ncbi:MAG: hypothetical protein GF346_05990 [Candidatus Eisenbacteria bacterium]|nr:hypothetical protein [Candidatus Latescibacterota bacterium]MBD3301980.1 hypothetical protein [Candidatus Eisenbacteria bacterium]
MRTALLALSTIGISLFFAPVPRCAASGWTELDSGTAARLHAVHFTAIDRGVAVGAAGVGLRTTDAGATWESLEMATGVDLHDVHFVETVGVAVGDGGTIVRTTDSGTTWTVVSSGVTDGLRSVSLSGSNGVCGGQSQTILTTTDAGASWEIAQSGFFGGGFFGAVMLGPDHAFVGGQNSIFQPLAGRSTDGGASWSFTPFYLQGNEGSLARIDFTDANTGYAAAAVWDGSGAISRTADGGETWTSRLFPERLHGISFPISDAGLVGYCVGSAGTILKTVDAGSSWTAQESGTAVTLRDVHFVDFDNGYAVGDGGAILKTTSGGEPPSGIVEEIPSERAEPGAAPAFRPNPFRTATTLHFTLSEGGNVEIALLDVTGRRVRTLFDGRLASGSHSVAWDGRDDSGSRLKAGVYAYRVALPGNRHGGTVILSK